MSEQMLHSIFGIPALRTPPTNHRWPEFVGIELELEGIPDGIGPSISGWVAHGDGSLRNGIEYVTDGPVIGDQISGVLDSFYSTTFFYTNGPRTSTHIHLNMMDTTVSHLRSMFILMYMIEDGIYNIVEEGRKWAGYSVALSEMNTTRIRHLLNPNVNPTVFYRAVSPSRNAERYYGFNTNVARHGTVEFRYFPGGPSREELESWLDLVVLIKRASSDLSATWMTDNLTSPEAVSWFIEQRFGEWGRRLLAAHPAERMYDRLLEVLPLSEDQDVRSDYQRVYFMTPLYLNAVKKHALRDYDKAWEYLKPLASSAIAHSANEWIEYLGDAVGMVPSKLKPSNNFQASLRGRVPPFVPFEDDGEDYDSGEYEPDYGEEAEVANVSEYNTPMSEPQHPDQPGISPPPVRPFIAETIRRQREETISRSLDQIISDPEGWYLFNPNTTETTAIPPSVPRPTRSSRNRSRS